MDTIATILQWACLLASLFYLFYDGKPIYLRAFPVYFLVSIATTIYGKYLSNHGITNIPLSNAFNTLEFSFNFFILSFIIQNSRIKKVLIFFGLFFPVLFFLNVYNYQGRSVFFTVPYGVGCLLIAMFCVIYFVELFQMPKAIDLMKSPPFWICTATLFSYTCSFPYWGMVNLLTLSESSYEKAFALVTVINILSYVLFIIAFLCRIRIRRSTS